MFTEIKKVSNYKTYCFKMLFKAFVVLLTYLAYTLSPKKSKFDMIHYNPSGHELELELDPGVQKNITVRTWYFDCRLIGNNNNKSSVSVKYSYKWFPLGVPVAEPRFKECARFKFSTFSAGVLDQSLCSAPIRPSTKNFL